MKLEALAMLANDPLKLNNAINSCLINLKMVLYHIVFLH